MQVLQFHSTMDDVLVGAPGTSLKVWDVAKQQRLPELVALRDLVQGTGLELSGGLAGSMCKDQQLQICDPRTKSEASQDTQVHENSKGGR